MATCLYDVYRGFSLDRIAPGKTYMAMSPKNEQREMLTGNDSCLKNILARLRNDGECR